ncbi:DUF6443 domain-containing protein [Chryseobacterium taeanense]|uniref:DUF6443 domain-containing protein n=1 Tax=Chryseobacterium taeanense TaxID=311334 RepID=UPI0035AF808F
MKKIIIQFSALLLSGWFQAQLSTTENYVYSKTYIDYDTNNQPTKASETVQYFDGLGRAKQLVNIKASPQGKDVVIPAQYDDFGRSVVEYLPIPQQGTLNGAIAIDPLASVLQTPYGNEKIYSEKNLENSPLDRILSQKQVGNAWDSKPVQFGYDSNIDGEVKRYNATFNYTTFESSITASGSYGAKQLYKSTLIDEDGYKTIEFKNAKGQVLLLRKVNGTESADTYYVYNDYNQLAFVIPPKGAVVADPNMVLNDLCYQYKYDGKNRLVEKKLPGKGWEYMVYDKQDRLVLTRDMVLEAQGKWLFTKYDQFSRPIYTGILDSPPGRAQQVVAVEGLGSNNEVRTTSSFNNTGIDVYYTTNSAYPQYNYTLLSVNYYDTYPGYSFNPAFPTMILGEAILTDTPSTDGLSTKNLPVMNLVKNIEDDNWTKSYSYYDKKARLIGSYIINHLGGRTKLDSKLNFAGAVQQTVTIHKRLDTDIDHIITENFEYDSQNRLLVHKHQVDTNPVEILTQNTYNEISQITNKKVGGSVASSPLQSIDYAYNIRGWMTKINDPVNLNGKFFGYEMRYNNPVNSNIAPGKYNGNIAEIDWKNSTEDVLKRYNYEYDSLNRLKNAFYKEPTTGNNNYFDEYLTYDLNGNISNLKRTAVPPVLGASSTMVDNLDYIYSGNRLTQVVENALNHTGYEGGNNTIDHDVNGNMTNMKDKGIQNIYYNHLSLPDYFSITQTDPWTGSSVSFGLSYLYSADGVKLRKIYTTGGGRGQSTTNVYTDYLNGFQYKFSETVAPCLWCRTSVAYEEQAFRDPIVFDKPPVSLGWSLDFVPTSEGFYSFAENRYIYQYLDHVGNVRVSFAKNSQGFLEVIDTNNYYAFGMNHIGGTKSVLGGYQNYKYNGKEIQESGMYDYGARMYMPDLGRWGVIDPLAEKSRRFSPYAYALNNPVYFMDPDGMDVIESSWGTTYTGMQAQEAFLQLQNQMDNGPKPKIISRKEWGAKAPILEGRSYEQISPTTKMFGLFDVPVKGVPIDLSKYYNSITVHHSGNKDDYLTIQDLQIKEQRDGYADIPYHFAIDKNGNIYEGRPIDVKGSHVKGGNTGNIGIVLLSDLDTENRGLGFFQSLLETSDGGASKAMRQSLTDLVIYLNDKYGIQYLGGHKEKATDPRNCPGNGGMKIVEYLRNKLHMLSPKNEN